MSDPLQASADRWLEVSRLESWAGELRVNLIRIAGIILFYGRHLIEMVNSPAGSPSRGDYHLRITAIVLIWAGAAGAIHILLQKRFYPPAMKFLVSLSDLLFITVICALAGGPKTPLILLYFIVIAMAPLRLSLPLVYFATAGAMLGYLFLLGYYVWYLIGFDRYYQSPSLRISRGEEAIVLLALLTAGFLAGQNARQTRRIVTQKYPVTLAADA